MPSSVASSSISYPTADPPVILPEDSNDGSRPTSSRAFLSNTPAYGSSIDVYTHQHEYQILVKLPGFTWDGITLATQKRRVLHIVADKWDSNGGGHFERRVAFGCDADLGSVRAEFNNDWLRVHIPRRLAHITSMQYAPIGRST